MDKVEFLEHTVLEPTRLQLAQECLVLVARHIVTFLVPAAFHTRKQEPCSRVGGEVGGHWSSEILGVEMLGEKKTRDSWT